MISTFDEKINQYLATSANSFSTSMVMHRICTIHKRRPTQHALDRWDSLPRTSAYAAERTYPSVETIDSIRSD